MEISLSDDPLAAWKKRIGEPCRVLGNENTEIDLVRKWRGLSVIEPSFFRKHAGFSLEENSERDLWRGQFSDLARFPE